MRITRDGLKPQFAGAPTMLTAGVWALSPTFGRALAEGYSSTSVARTAAGGAAILAVGADAYDWFGSKYAKDTPKTEVIVNVSVSDDANYLARSTNVYYVNDSDQSLYNSVPVKRFSVVGE